jgi:hypothetical protein
MNTLEITMNIESLRILANSDQDVFAETITSFGMKVIGTKSDDPLEKRVEVESVQAMASEITEDVNDNVDLTPAQSAIRKIAEEVGLIVTVCEN